jgi:hypothetical protein
LVVLVFALAACSGDDGDEGASASAASTQAASTTAVPATAPVSTSPPLALMPAACAEAVDEVNSSIDQRLDEYEAGPDFAEAGRQLAFDIALQLDAAVAAGCAERQGEVASLVVVHLLNASIAHEDATSAMGSWAVIHLCESVTNVVALDPDATLICEAAADSASVSTD